MKEQIEKLENLLNSSTGHFSKLSSKKMFGCHALWADGNVFAMVWKKGRIGLKLPTTQDYEALMSLSGAEPWKAGPMKMAHWVLVPESFHSKPAVLKNWASRAYDLCLGLEKKSASSGKTSSKGKSTAKKKVAKRATTKK